MKTIFFYSLALYACVVGIITWAKKHELNSEFWLFIFGWTLFYSITLNVVFAIWLFL